MPRIEIERVIPARKATEELRVGEWGYTVPWSVVVTPDRRIFFNSRYPLQDTEGEGTVHVRVSLDESGVVIIDGDSFEEDDPPMHTITTEFAEQEYYLPARLRRRANTVDLYEYFDRLPEDIRLSGLFDMRDGEVRYINPEQLHLGADGKLYAHIFTGADQVPSRSFDAKVRMIEGAAVISTRDLSGVQYVARPIPPEDIEEYMPVNILVESFLKQPRIVDTLPERFIKR